LGEEFWHAGRSEAPEDTSNLYQKVVRVAEGEEQAPNRGIVGGRGKL
jgi:hypothetical protein